MRKYYDLLCSIVWLLVGGLIYTHYLFDPVNLWLFVIASTSSFVNAGIFFISYLEGKHDDKL